MLGQDGLIQIYTGNGKGKTTAALGLVLLIVELLAARRRLDQSGTLFADGRLAQVDAFPLGIDYGRYRDAVRRFSKGDGNMTDFLDMVNGDYHHFHDSGGAQKTINFIDAHDGFTMADLVSYQTKVNDQPYPFGPSDGGTDDNLSWDSGGSQALRRQRVAHGFDQAQVAQAAGGVKGGQAFKPLAGVHAHAGQSFAAGVARGGRWPPSVGRRGTGCPCARSKRPYLPLLHFLKEQRIPDR